MAIYRSMVFLQEEAAAPYDWVFNVVTGNFGLTVVLLVICVRCLRRLESDLDRSRERTEPPP